jgi:hypothetical protein
MIAQQNYVIFEYAFNHYTDLTRHIPLAFFHSILTTFALLYPCFLNALSLFLRLFVKILSETASAAA